MRSTFTLFILTLGITYLSCAQTVINPDDAKFKLLFEKAADFHKKTDGTYDGYRIKIHFGADKTKAREIKSRFLSRYTDANSYEEYQQPNFVILVGDFRSKAEAFEYYKNIFNDFPNAFIVKDKINPIRFPELSNK